MLQCVRIRPVTNVMKECRGKRRETFFGSDRRPFGNERVEHFVHQRHGAKRVAKTGVLSTGKHHVADTKLPNAS